MVLSSTLCVWVHLCAPPVVPWDVVALVARAVGSLSLVQCAWASAEIRFRCLLRFLSRFLWGLCSFSCCRAIVELWHCVLCRYGLVSVTGVRPGFSPARWCCVCPRPFSLSRALCCRSWSVGRCLRGDRSTSSSCRLFALHPSVVGGLPVCAHRGFRGLLSFPCIRWCSGRFAMCWPVR